MLEKNEFINITNDGGIKKKIILKGKGEKPKNGDLVTILYIENKNRIELFPKRKIIKTFVLGSKKIMKGMEIGIRTMQVGEKSEFIFYTEYIYTDSNTYYFEKIQNKYKKILYEINLLKIEKNKRNFSYFGKIINIPKTKTNNYLENIERIISEHPLYSKIKKNSFDSKIKSNIKTDDNVNNKRINIKINEFYKTFINIKKCEEIKKKQIIKPKIEIKEYKELILKTDSLISENCYRLVYISFDFMKHFISTKCSYCNKFDIYDINKNTFIEKLKMINNPLFKCYCHKCLNAFHFSEKNFYLIEKIDYKFFVICESCINEDEYKDTIKKLKMKDIIEHNLFIYEKNKDFDKIKDLETKFLAEKTNLIKNLEIINDYEKKLDLIELISNNIFGSLRKIA